MSRQIILAFHGLGTPPDHIDADEKPYWIPVSMFASIIERTAATGEVVYTFDDGNRSDLVDAAPILRRHGRTGWFFVLTARLNDPAYLSPDDLRQMQDAGMTIGLHGQDHIDWRQADDDRLRAETVDARETLAEICGRPIDSVAIPFGAYNRRVIRRLTAGGFKAIMTTDQGVADDQHLIRNRTSIRSDMNEAMLGAILNGRSSALASLRRSATTFLKRHVI